MQTCGEILASQITPKWECSRQLASHLVYGCKAWVIFKTRLMPLVLHVTLVTECAEDWVRMSPSITWRKQHHLLRKLELAKLNSWATVFTCLMRNSVLSMHSLSQSMERENPEGYKSVPKVLTMSIKGSKWHARPTTALRYALGLLQLEKVCSRLLRSWTKMMM